MRQCALCWRPAVNRHHVFGAANRKHSEAYGLVVDLCYDCHAMVHRDYQEGLKLKRQFQAFFLETHSMDEWMSVFGRNYL